MCMLWRLCTDPTRFFLRCEACVHIHEAFVNCQSDCTHPWSLCKQCEASVYSSIKQTYTMWSMGTHPWSQCIRCEECVHIHKAYLHAVEPVYTSIMLIYTMWRVCTYRTPMNTLWSMCPGHFKRRPPYHSFTLVSRKNRIARQFKVNYFYFLPILASRSLALPMLCYL